MQLKLSNILRVGGRYKQLRHASWACAELPQRSIIRVGGADSADFLHAWVNILPKFDKLLGGRTVIVALRWGRWQLLWGKMYTFWKEAEHPNDFKGV